MACNEPTSGFVRSDDILRTDRFTDFSTVPSRGYNLLVRAKRHGRWWMLKGLKESYRNDAVYQVLLQKEYEITSQLQHPMIVSVFSLEEVEGLGPCIVMEWIEGLTLKEWLAQGKHSQNSNWGDDVSEGTSHQFSIELHSQPELAHLEACKRAFFCIHTGKAHIRL
ncbi:MAG: hypothetical protein IIT76_02285 [Prevotella sp.]|nr:hypothetical protein [Prevotella sp.]